MQRYVINLIIHLKITDKVEVLPSDYCCGNANIDDGRHKQDNEGVYISGNNLSKHKHCGPFCFDYCAALYRCPRHEVLLQPCHYKEVITTVTIDDQTIEVIGSPTLTVSPLLQALYKLWRNDTSIFLKKFLRRYEL
jgi:hypothetical protein